MRALRYYVACTADGFIAHADGSFDGFLMEGEHVADFLESYKWFDTVLMGRKTYEVGLREGKTNAYPMLRRYVFSRTMKASPDPNVTLISQNTVEVVRGLRREAGKDIWLCGGADLAGTFSREDLIDELVLKVHPVLFGSGIPLFAGAIQQSALQLVDSKVYGNGVVLLRYRVVAMTSMAMKPRVTSFAPQFLVEDLDRSIAYYRKLGFTFGEPWDGFYAIGSLDGLELHLKEAPKNPAERQYRRDNEHLDASAGVDGIEAFYERCVTNDVA